MRTRLQESEIIHIGCQGALPVHLLHTCTSISTVSWRPATMMSLGMLSGRLHARVTPLVMPCEGYASLGNSSPCRKPCQRTSHVVSGKVPLFEHREAGEVPAKVGRQVALQVADLEVPLLHMHKVADLPWWGALHPSQGEVDVRHIPIPGHMVIPWGEWDESLVGEPIDVPSRITAPALSPSVWRYPFPPTIHFPRHNSLKRVLVLRQDICSQFFTPRRRWECYTELANKKTSSKWTTAGTLLLNSKGTHPPPALSTRIAVAPLAVVRRCGALRGHGEEKCA